MTTQPSQSGSPWASHHLVNTIPGFRQCHSSGDSQASWDKDSTDDGSRFDTDNWNDSPTSQPGIIKKRKRSGGNYRVHRAKHAPLGPSFPAIESVSNLDNPKPSTGGSLEASASLIDASDTLWLAWEGSSLRTKGAVYYVQTICARWNRRTSSISSDWSNCQASMRSR
ncbi:hypothetical protein XANCAGTX0491_004483 [Xanthoria calcicola]